MVEVKDLKKFVKLPPEFNREIIREICRVLDDYAACRAYVADALEHYGELAFKNPDCYLQVSCDILNAELPESFTEKLLAALEQMKKEYCVTEKERKPFT